MIQNILVGNPYRESMKHLKNNLLLQISLATMIIITVLTVIITTSLSSGLEQNINFLTIHQEIDEGRITASSDRYSIANLIRETTDLKFKASLIIGCGFLLLYIFIYVIVRAGWNTITSQRRRLEAVNQGLSNSLGNPDFWEEHEER